MRAYTQLLCFLLLIGLAMDVQAQIKTTRPRVRVQELDLNRIFGRCGCTNCDGLSEHHNPTEDGETNFEIVNRWTFTALSGGGLGQGTPTMLTWSIVPDGTDANGGGGFVPSNMIAVFDNLFNEPSAGDPDLTTRFWHGLIQQSLDRWGEVSGIEYVFEPNDDGATNFGAGGSVGVRGDVRIGGFNIDGPNNVLAFNQFPNVGDMAIDTSDLGLFGNAALGFRLFRNVFSHEQGHGIGFAHLESNNAAFLMEPFISGAFDGPQLDDILAVQRQYGDALEKENNFQGNNTIGNASELGSIADGDIAIIGIDGSTGTVVAGNDVDFVSIDDNSDVDFFSFTVTELGFADIVLTPVGASYNQSPQFQGGGIPSNPSAFANLSLTLFDANGSAFAASNSQPAGSQESILAQFLAPGEYFARVSGSTNNVQLYTLRVEFDAIDVPVPTAPSIASFESGEIIAGDVADLLDSDNQYLELIPNLDGAPANSGVEAFFTFFSPDILVSSFSIDYEGAANTPNLEQTVSVLNASTGLFEEIVSGPVGLTDDDASFSPAGDPQQYVAVPSGLVLVEARYEETGPVLFYPWTISIDQMVINTLGN